MATDLPAQDVYEVLVYDQKRHKRLAAVEIVSPSNKDRPESRQAFVTKCAALMLEQVSVVILDLVTTRTQNLYAEMLDRIGHADPSLPADQPLYAAASRLTRRENEWYLEAWTRRLVVGHPLHTVPLWLADNFAVPLELEESYEKSREILNLP